MPISRREALHRVGITGAAIATTATLGASLWTPEGATKRSSQRAGRIFDFRAKQDDPSAPQFVVSKSASSPEGLVRQAVRALGGMKRFVAPGDVVALKPNIGWDRSPIHAANTNPRVVAEVVRLAYEAGASRVIVSDSSCNDPQRSFDRSGIWKAAYDANAEVVLPAPHKFRVLRMKGKILHEWPILSPIIDADKVINLPIAKQHNLAKFTGAMKNWYGLLSGRRNRLHQAIDLSIADLASFVRPTLTIMDATRVLVRNGPQGGNIADTRALGIVIASVDQVAVDTYGCKLIGQTPGRIPYLTLAEKRGLGTTKLDRLRTKEV